MYRSVFEAIFALFARRNLADAEPSERGFLECDPHRSNHFRRIGRTFLLAYNCALRCPETHWSALFESEEAQWRGFACEGAAMAIALKDTVLGNKQRWSRYTSGPADSQVYVAYVGAGWVMGVCKQDIRRVLAQGPDPLLSALAFDGYGFHQGFYFHAKYLAGEPYPERLKGYETRAFDQGLGRSLWFVTMGDPSRARQAIERLDHARRPDLWSGVALASAYAGGVPGHVIRQLRLEARGYEAELAQGASFAAEARTRATIMVPATEAACEILCGTDANEAAAISRESRAGLDGADVEAYETWRARVRDCFARTPGANK